MVPRSRRRQEQPRRARALAALGAVETRDVGEVTAEQITDWWARSVTGRTSRSHIDLGGLGVVAHLAAQLLPAASASAPVSVPALQEVSRHVG